MSPLEQARLFGQRTAEARFNHDESRALYEREAFRKWMHVEVHGFDRVPEQRRSLRAVLETEFAEGYRETYRALGNGRPA